jgi:hypothetical protein
MDHALQPDRELLGRRGRADGERLKELPGIFHRDLPKGPSRL